MGFFPCLRHGENRWWLPLTSSAQAVIANVLLARQDGGCCTSIPALSTGDDRNHHVSSCDRLPKPLLPKHLCSAVRHAIVTEPTLFLYCALNWPHESASLDDLAEWLIENASGRFASGDAFLGAPPIQTAHQQRWRKLSAHYATLAITDWMRDAPLWLEVTGPPIPVSWHQRWPEIDLDAEELLEEVSDADQPISFLQKLARKTQRATALESSFDERLHRAKLGAIKQLAYGLSHEINNPLANISTRAQQLQRGESDPQRHSVLQRIVDQVYRAHEMIADLMFYANPPAARYTRCDLATIVGEVVSGFGDLQQTHQIHLQWESPEQPAWADVDRAMVAEAIRVLIRNSVEAVGHGGTIVVSMEMNQGRCNVHVADSGPGLSPKDREHAFDPYYSGREAGRGLGLGLCRAYRVTRLHEGEIALSGGPAGCVATVSLPAGGRKS